MKRVTQEMRLLSLGLVLYNECCKVLSEIKKNDLENFKFECTHKK